MSFFNSSSGMIFDPLVSRSKIICVSTNEVISSLLLALIILNSSQEAENSAVQSNRLYSDYGDNINSADSRHQAIDNLDNQKPAVDIVSGFMIFPIIYYYSKQLEMERWLKR